MNEIECETCIKRKTVYCPNHVDCYDTINKPYYQNRIMLLEKNKQLKEQLQQKEDIINKANEILTKEYKENVFEHYEYDLYKAVNTLKKLLEILDNKGE